MIHKKRIIAGCIAGTMVFTAAGALYRNSQAKNQEIYTEQTEVQKGTIRKIIQGTGTLAPDGMKEIRIPEGVRIRDVKVKNGDEVKAGDVLATVDGNSVMEELLKAKESIADLEKRIQKADQSKASYYEMVKQRENLLEKQRILQSIKDSGNVTADAAGVVLNVNNGKDKAGAGETAGTAGRQSDSGTAVYTAGRIWPMAARNSGQAAIIERIPEIQLKAPAAGEKLPPDPEETPQYRIKIKWSPKTEVFAADTVYTAEVEIEAKEGCVFQKDLKLSVPGAQLSDIDCEKDESGGIVQIRFAAVFPRTEGADTDNGESGEAGGSENTEPPKGDQEPSGPCDPQPGKPQPSQPEGSDTQGNQPQVNQPQSTRPQSTSPQSDPSQNTLSAQDSPAAAGMNPGNVFSGTGTGDTGRDAGADAGAAEEKGAGTEMNTLCTIASGEKLAVEIQVDELDILSVSLGQKAEVTLNARPEKQYEGVISRINKNGTSQNGTTKYGVQILLPKDGEMFFGMNVSAAILTAEKQDVLVLPAEAVLEKGGQSWVYLSADDKTGQLGKEQEIQTGLSDGVQIEIVKGVKEGQTVYYEPGTGSDFTEDFLTDDMGVMP